MTRLHLLLVLFLFSCVPVPIKPEVHHYNKAHYALVVTTRDGVKYAHYALVPLRLRCDECKEVTP